MSNKIMNRVIYQVDAFTKEKFKGNPAGVVLNAEGLSENEMQQIAGELNNSETAFIFPSNGKDNDGVIRYFTPTVEVPICGHATISAMYVKAVAENLDSCVLHMKTGVGTLPFEIIKSTADYKIKMTQGAISFIPPFKDKTKDEIINALGLRNIDIDEKCPLQIASTGHSKVMIGVKKNTTLTTLKPDNSRLIELSNIIGCNGYYVFTFDTTDPNYLIEGRMFAPAIGINEDPVTGNANGPLGAYLVHHNLVSHNNKEFTFKIKQGKKMGRTGYMDVTVTIAENQPEKVQITGDAVIIFKTEITL